MRKLQTANVTGSSVFLLGAVETRYGPLGNKRLSPQIHSKLFQVQMRYDPLGNKRLTPLSP